jgi:hypothetical protein
MGLSEEQQEKALELRNITNGRSGAKESLEVLVGGCFQGNGDNMTSIDSRDPAHEELDVCTKGNNDDTLLHVLIYF